MKTTKLKLFRDCKAVGAIAGIGFLLLALNACTTDADSFDAATVCPVEGTNIYGMPNRGTFIDERDGREYAYITVGEQVWMNDNLKFQMEKSVCFEGLVENCEKFGRLYAIQYGVNEKGVYDSTYGFLNDYVVNGACPENWHIPTLSEWEILIKKTGGRENVQEDKCLLISPYSQGGVAYNEGSSRNIAYSNGGQVWWTQTVGASLTIAGSPTVYYLDFGLRDACVLTTASAYFPIRCIKD